MERNERAPVRPWNDYHLSKIKNAMVMKTLNLTWESLNRTIYINDECYINVLLDEVVSSGYYWQICDRTYDRIGDFLGKKTMPLVSTSGSKAIVLFLFHIHKEGKARLEFELIRPLEDRPSLDKVCYEICFKKSHHLQKVLQSKNELETI
jgi:hypothetical protein